MPPDDEPRNLELTAEAARARARLALRAERAFGVNAVRGRVRVTGSDVNRRDEVRNPQLPLRRRSPVEAPPAPPPPSTPPAREPRDLFGSSTPSLATIPASEAGDKAPFPEPAPDRATRIALLQAMDENEVTGCTRCPLHEGRTRTVFGEGDPEARLMFVGEGPGENEDKTGRPFVGRAGELLNKMIASMGLTREQVFIANVVKCRPPNNRVPTALEVSTCTTYLHRQIEWIRPEVIVPLGLPATRHLLHSTLAMGKLRGRWHQWRGIPVMPTYHPAYLLRSYTEANRRAVWGDLREVMKALGQPGP